MNEKRFETPMDAEAAFYDALQRRDLDAMMEVWSERDDISCIHPLRARATGRAAVRESWAVIFGASAGIAFEIQAVHRTQEPGLAIHQVHERLTLGHTDEPRPPVIATNVYRLTAAGWRIILHHASPLPSEPAPVRRPTTAMH